MSDEWNTEFITTSRRKAESAMRRANGRGTDMVWAVTEFDRGLVTHYCLTRADGLSDQRATRGQLTLSAIRNNA